MEVESGKAEYSNVVHLGTTPDGKANVVSDESGLVSEEIESGQSRGVGAGWVMEGKDGLGQDRIGRSSIRECKCSYYFFPLHSSETYFDRKTHADDCIRRKYWNWSLHRFWRCPFFRRTWFPSHWFHSYWYYVVRECAFGATGEVRGGEWPRGDLISPLTNLSSPSTPFSDCRHGSRRACFQLPCRWFFRCLFNSFHWSFLGFRNGLVFSRQSKIPAPFLTLSQFGDSQDGTTGPNGWSSCLWNWLPVSSKKNFSQNSSSSFWLLPFFLLPRTSSFHRNQLLGSQWDSTQRNLGRSLLGRSRYH